MQIMVECQKDGKRSDEDLLKLLIAKGAQEIPGMLPIPMLGSSVVFTVEVPDDKIERLKSLTEVIQIYTDPNISPF